MLIAFLFTNFLFFLDEGYFNFNWTFKGWNWVFFLIYFIFIVLGQQFAEITLLRKYNGSEKTFLSILLGVVVGLASVYSIGFTFKAIVDSF